MPGVCFFFEEWEVDVWSGRRIDLDAWNYAIKAAGDIDEVVVVNRTATPLTSFDVSLRFTEVWELPHLDNAAVLCCPWERGPLQMLWTFDHDVDWYIFGPAAGWAGDPPPGKRVTIPQAGQAAMHSMHVASAVMLHRYGAVA